MYTIVSQMLDTLARKDEQISILEEIYAEDCKCESAHNYTKCTYEVTHIMSRKCTGTRVRVCQASADFNRETMAEPEALCKKCRQPVIECWRLLPV